MFPFSEPAPLWELSQQSSFPQSSDEDFFALLQKHYPNPNGNPLYTAPVNGLTTTAIDPQNLSRYTVDGISPPSEESSSSPSPSANGIINHDHEEGSKRRRVSVADSDDDQPSHKAQHTLGNDRRLSSSRRKSTGERDEARLLKRKEQNRAAQRAFRERKEKHVKDLEDKVAALEAKNDAAQSENENLRDLLGRLQKENMTLKQASFTFAVPKNAASSSDPAYYGSNVGASSSTPNNNRPNDTFDFNSVTTLDPNMLSLLDDTPQSNMDESMNMDFGFGSSAPYTTIASNPDYMSFASYFDNNSTSTPQQNASSPPFTFDMNSMTSWTAQSPSQNSTNSLSDIFGGFGSNVDFQSLVASTPSLSSSSLSPVSHTNIETPSHKGSSPNIFGSNHNSNTDQHPMNGQKCPNTRDELVSYLSSDELSPFAPSPNLTLKKTEGQTGPMIMCQGSTFPKTPLSDKNVPLMDVWRDITGNPKFKDVDINQLCEEFSCKAKCDGTKVVLEPDVVDSIMVSLNQRTEGPNPTTTQH
jgi:AP-1-like factor